MKVWLSCLKHLLKREKFWFQMWDDPTDSHTRRVALAETVVDGKGPLQLLVSTFLGGIKVSKKNGHDLGLSWKNWTSLFLAGDFNNPTGQEGYQAILASPLGLQDAFEVAPRKVVAIPFHQKLMAGRRIQNPYESTTSLHQRVRGGKFTSRFDGQNSPQVSDHYGLNAILTWK